MHRMMIVHNYVEHIWRVHVQDTFLIGFTAFRPQYRHEILDYYMSLSII